MRVRVRVDIMIDDKLSRVILFEQKKLTSASFKGYCLDTLSMWMYERLGGIAASNALDNAMRSAVAAASVGVMFMMMGVIY